MAKISVIIPTYNRTSVLPNAIQSVRNQTYADWELIIVDDGSTDNTKEVVESYLHEKRIRYFYQENKGVSAARNYGMSLAGGEYLVFLDSDDRLLSETLEGFNRVAAENASIDVFVAGYYRNKHGDSHKHLAKENVYNATLPGTFMIRKDFIESMGGYDPQLKYAENTDLFYRIEQKKGSVKVMDSLTLEYLDSPTGGSKNNKNKIDSLRLILNKHQGRLSSHVQFLYLQIIGVCLIREGQYKEASLSLWKAYRLKPQKLVTVGRWGIAKLPFLARLIYPISPS